MASDGGTKPVLGYTDMECGLCIKKGKHREAQKYCQECEAYICNSCTDSHGRFPALRRHKTVSMEDMTKNCGLCNADGKQKEAKCFCKDCGSWICEDCKESHDNFRELRNHTIVSKNTTFHSDSTAPCDMSTQSSQSSTKPLEGGLFPTATNETKPQNKSENKKANTSSKPSGDDATSGSFTKPFLDPVTADQHIISNVLLVSKVSKLREINIKCSGDRTNPSINGLCFMPGGELVLCDYNNDKIKVLDRFLSVVDSIVLPGQIWEVAVVDSSNVLVTMFGESRLQFVQVLPTLKMGRGIDVQDCWGVAVAADKIFVGGMLGEIEVYDVEGKNLGKRFGKNSAGSPLFKYSRYVAVSRSGEKIFVSDDKSNTVTCLTNEGKIVYQYRDEGLREPCGLFIDDKDNAIVCGYESNTIHVITPAGKKHKTLLSKKDGIIGPKCVSLTPDNGALLVNRGASEKMFVYKLS